MIGVLDAIHLALTALNGLLLLLGSAGDLQRATRPDPPGVHWVYAPEDGPHTPMTAPER